MSHQNLYMFIFDKWLLGKTARVRLSDNWNKQSQYEINYNYRIYIIDLFYCIKEIHIIID